MIEHNMEAFDMEVRDVGAIEAAPGAGSFRFTVGCFVLVALLAIASMGVPRSALAADPEPHQVLWAHPAPSAVGSFVVFVSAEPGAVAGARRYNVGKPAGGGWDEEVGQLFSARVPVAADEVVAVGALRPNGSLASISEEWRSVPPSRPGQPLIVGP